MSIIKIAISTIVFFTINTADIFGQSSSYQMVKSNFNFYIAPRLDGGQLKTNILQGDLNGDNQIDFAIEYCIQSRGSKSNSDNPWGGPECFEDGIAIYLKQGVNYILSVDRSIENFKDIEDVSIKAFKIENQAIVCNMISYKTDDAIGYPSLEQTIYLKLNNGRFEKYTNLPDLPNLQKIQNWTGMYTDNSRDYVLTIGSDNSCIYEETPGIQKYFKVACRGQLNGSRYEIYFVKILDGGYHQYNYIDKSKPILILYYKNNVLYTAYGQNNSRINEDHIFFEKLK